MNVIDILAKLREREERTREVAPLSPSKALREERAATRYGKEPNLEAPIGSPSSIRRVPYSGRIVEGPPAAAPNGIPRPSSAPLKRLERRWKDAAMERENTRNAARVAAFRWQQAERERERQAFEERAAARVPWHRSAEAARAARMKRR